MTVHAYNLALLDLLADEIPSVVPKPICNVESLVAAHMVELKYYDIRLATVDARAGPQVRDQIGHPLLQNPPIPGRGLIDVALLVLGVVPLLVFGSTAPAICLPPPLVLATPRELIIRLGSAAPAALPHGCKVARGCDGIARWALRHGASFPGEFGGEVGYRVQDEVRLVSGDRGIVPAGHARKDEDSGPAEIARAG